jgi:hypothetical protein
MLGLRREVSAPLLMMLLFWPKGAVVVVGAAGVGITRHPAPLAILYFVYSFTQLCIDTLSEDRKIN